MTLQEFLTCCSEWEATGNPDTGLRTCEQLLANGARGRLRVAALQKKAQFLLRSRPDATLEAVGCLKEALRCANPHPADLASLLHLLIIAYAFSGATQSAGVYAARFFQLVEANRDNREVTRWLPKVYFNLGYCHDTAGQFDLAVAAYTRAVETADLAQGGFNLGMAENNLVQMYLALGRVDDAVAMLERARAHLDLAQFGSHFEDQEAQCLLAVGRTADARQACLKSLSHPACDEAVKAEVVFTLARIAAAEGDFDSAAATADQAKDLAASTALARLLHRIEAFQQSLQK